MSRPQVELAAALPGTRADRRQSQPGGARKPRRRIDGVLLLDKPCGITSNAALQSARRLLNAAKAGHTGTLDPMASGLLPLAFGEATKFSQTLLEADKTYEAELLLGVSTDSGDADGQVLATAAVEVDETDLARVLEQFRGQIEQLPPMFSALKRDGKPLYEYARAGIEVERTPRQVMIHELSLLERAGARLRLRVACSKGTYIRSLAMDIGAMLGCGAHLTALRRTRVGTFTVADACTLDELEQLLPAERERLLAPVDVLLHAWPSCDLDADQARDLLQGRAVTLRPPSAPGPVRVYAVDCGAQATASIFLGLAHWGEDGKLAPRRLIDTRETHLPALLAGN